MHKILVVIGTRPEAIKMAPVIWAMKEHLDAIQPLVCVTGQHRHMLDQMLTLFQITPDYDLDIMAERQSLAMLSARIMTKMETLLVDLRPDWIFVQGDTTTAAIASLVGFYNHVNVGHVEAGLRTKNKRAPFPEEINRRVISVIGDLHFAPTENARQALLEEGIPDSTIAVTGNTVIDSLFWVRDRVRKQPPILPDGLFESIQNQRLILVTGHRRESFGEGFSQICQALRMIAQRFPDVSIIYPVHLNPNVQEPVHRLLGGQDRIHLIDPQPYDAFVWLMDQSYLVLTDSGGVQEEAPSLGKPTLVMRETTERQEGLTSGNTILVCANQASILRHTADLLNSIDKYQEMTIIKNIYGDGRASTRIVQKTLEFIAHSKT